MHLYVMWFGSFATRTLPWPGLRVKHLGVLECWRVMSKCKRRMTEVTGQLFSGQPSKAFTVIGLASFSTRIKSDETGDWEIKLPTEPESRKADKTCD